MIFGLYQDAGHPSAKTIAAWSQPLELYVSHTTVNELMTARTKGQSPLPGLSKVQNVAKILAAHSVRPGGAVDEGQIQRLWSAACHPELLSQPVPAPAAAADSVPHKPSLNFTIDPTLHFARVGWLTAQEVLAPLSPGPAQGAVTLAAIEGPVEAGERILSRPHQRRIKDIQEVKYIRRDGHAFASQEGWTPTSYRVYGLTSGSRGHSHHFVELTERGVITVFFADGSARTLDEIVAYWVKGAWELALACMASLGFEGHAYGVTSLMIPHPNPPVSRRKANTSSPILNHVSHGRVSLLERELAIEGAWGRGREYRDFVHHATAQYRPESSPWDPLSLARSVG